MPTTIIALFSAGLFIYGLFADIHILRLCTKPIPILALLWMVYNTKPNERWLLGALIFSLLGDMILELPNLLPFALGLASFLIAHILYIRRFLLFPTQKIWWPLVPISLYCLSLFACMIPNLGVLLLPVALYIVVIATMLWSACIYAHTTTHRVPLFGAMIFVISDSLIAINKFIIPFPQARYAIIVTYWLAQFMIIIPFLSKEKQ